MTWLKFATWILISYGVYYAAIISWDSLRSERSPREKQADVLTFAEDHEVIKPALEESVPVPQAPIKGSGGVDLKQLFALCRDETVEYRKAVSY